MGHIGICLGSDNSCLICRMRVKNDTFSGKGAYLSKMKKKNQIFVFEGSTTLNPSAFGATLDSAGKK